MQTSKTPHNLTSVGKWDCSASLMMFIEKVTSQVRSWERRCQNRHGRFEASHSVAFHLKHMPPLRAGAGPVAVAVTEPGSFGLVAR
jgi:hypothetical protein